MWPAVLGTARQPFRSRTWIAALSVIVERDGGDFGRTRRLGAVRFEQAVRRQITKRGGQKPCLRIVNKLRPTQAQTVTAAAILRHLHALISTGQRWDPAIATHGHRARREPADAAA